MPPFNPRTWNGYNPKGRLHMLSADLSLATFVSDEAKTKAEILSILHRNPHWLVIGTRTTADEMVIHLIRKPDALAPHGVYIRAGWHVVKAVVEAHLHYVPAGAGAYVFHGRSDFALLEAPYPLAPLVNGVRGWWYRQLLSKHGRQLRRIRRTGHS